MADPRQRLKPNARGRGRVAHTRFIRHTQRESERAGERERRRYSRSRHLEVKGVRLAYDDIGVGPTILFIHGFMLDRTMWRSQVAALEGWRRIAPDLRGHGLSEATRFPTAGVRRH
ncbi:MAG: hypothetical protein EOR84_33895 [Mesorhizobium sp.]|uniref:alpha/beta fold hydrolase n=1 Tax=Mesorhizobium sp. TaxID=1871066 RepID=UPI000FE60593|nr:alpha/beta fold hydrolase [Mesorhizobium sp.]RWM83214.1 MAG: hypothetical protein EOR84_33895 [Mesorhizobium sp.]